MRKLYMKRRKQCTIFPLQNPSFAIDDEVWMGGPKKLPQKFSSRPLMVEPSKNVGGSFRKKNVSKRVKNVREKNVWKMLAIFIRAILDCYVFVASAFSSTVNLWPQFSVILFFLGGAVGTKDLLGVVARVVPFSQKRKFKFSSEKFREKYGKIE